MLWGFGRGGRQQSGRKDDEQQPCRCVLARKPKANMLPAPNMKLYKPASSPSAADLPTPAAGCTPPGTCLPAHLVRSRVQDQHRQEGERPPAPAAQQRQLRRRHG